MKYIKLLYFIPLSILLLISSCKYNCAYTQIDQIYLTSYGVYDSTDTIITIKKYAAGSNFTNFQDSVVLYSSQNGYYRFGYNFSPNSEYVIGVYPIGKIHQLKNIHEGNEKGSDQEGCTVSVSYQIDDSIVHIGSKDDGGGDAIIYITN